MAEDVTGTAAAEPEVTPAPVAETPPEPEPVVQPDLAAELAREREARARLEGQVAALSQQVQTVARQPAPPAQAMWTPQTIRQAYEAGTITDDQRIDLIADLRSKTNLEAERAANAVNTRRADAARDLDAYLHAYPDLRQADSALMREVAAELSQIQAEFGLDPRDPIAQHRAVKSVIGNLKTRPDGTGVARRSIPVASGGAPSGGGAARDPGKSDPLKEIPADYVAEWRRLGASLDDPVKAKQYADRYWANEARRGRTRRTA